MTDKNTGKLALSRVEVRMNKRNKSVGTCDITCEVCDFLHPFSGCPHWHSESVVPECYCGQTIKLIDVPGNLREMSGIQQLWIHITSGDTLCYPDSENEDDRAATAGPINV